MPIMKNCNLINFPMFVAPNGNLAVYEKGKEITFDIERIFTVTGHKGDRRGSHAHKKCTQLLICVAGKIRVTCDNGTDLTEYILSDVNQGLEIPAGVWAEQEYIENHSVLVVLCDRVYEEDDYLRDYSKYKDYIQTSVVDK